ncbi:cupin domain-containing protein [Streptosporangium lutulentum]
MSKKAQQTVRGVRHHGPDTAVDDTRQSDAHVPASAGASSPVAMGGRAAAGGAFGEAGASRTWLYAARDRAVQSRAARPAVRDPHPLGGGPLPRPRETAPAHRHSQTAFRFVVEGESVWTNVDGDAVAMRRGDLLLAPSWTYHEHHNATDRPMIWLDGLDIPLVNGLDADFFEFGLDTLSTCETPERSRGERLWGHPGLRPIGQADRPSSPLTAYRWEHTDAALRAQLEMETEDVPSAVIEPGHAGVRFSNPTTGKDSLVTIRTEMHRLREGTRTAPVKTVGSAVWQVFEGTGVATVGDRRFEISKGDLFVVPSWYELVLEAGGDIDLFRFSDEPVYEALGLADTYRGGA